jgi:hypothetical protein
LIPKVLCIFGSYHLRILHFSSKLYFYHVSVTRCLEQRKNYQKRKRTGKGSTDNILITKIVNLSVYGFILERWVQQIWFFPLNLQKRKEKKDILWSVILFSIQFNFWFLDSCHRDLFYGIDNVIIRASMCLKGCDFHDYKP